MITDLEIHYFYKIHLKNIYINTSQISDQPKPCLKLADPSYTKIFFIEKPCLVGFKQNSGRQGNLRASFTISLQQIVHYSIQNKVWSTASKMRTYIKILKCVKSS